MQALARDISEWSGGYIAEVEEDKVVLEAKLREHGFDEASMPVLESIPPQGTNLF